MPDYIIQGRIRDLPPQITSGDKCSLLNALRGEQKMIAGQAEMCSGCLELARWSPQSVCMIRHSVFALLTVSFAFCSELCTTRACWFDHGVRSRLAGNYSEAEASFLTALAISSEAKPAFATIQHSLGILYNEAGRYREAELALRQALGDEANASAATTKQLGDVLAALGRNGEAEQLLRKALRAFESGEGTRADTAATWNSLGMLHYAAGELSKADKEYRQALAIFQAGDPVDCRAIAGVLVNLGQAARFEHRYRDAEDYLRKAILLQEQTFGASHPRIAITLNHLGRTYADQHAYAAAEPVYARALRIAAASGKPELPIVITIRRNLAEVYAKRGALPEAEQEYRTALASAVSMFGETHPTVREILTDYAAVLRQLKRKREARDLETRASLIQRGPSAHSIDVKLLQAGTDRRSRP